MRYCQFIALSLMGVCHFWGASVAAAQTRDEKVRQDRAKLLDDDSWYYDDLDAGFAAAKEQSKPLMAVLRCIP